jgi:hypothetical protein
MQFPLNRTIGAGLGVAILTAFSALLGAPHGLDGFRLPLWELLLQLNLCSGFVLLIVGVLESVETPLPDYSSALRLFLAAFVAYGAACAGALVFPFAALLFLFSLSLACLAAGWVKFGYSLFQLLDALE